MVLVSGSLEVRSVVLRTDEGRNRAQAALSASRYVGPAPVPLAQFSDWIERQSVRNHQVSKETLGQAFSDLVLPPEPDLLG